MSKNQSLYKSGENVSVRIFSNNLLNELTKTKWWTPALVFLPVIIYFIYSAFSIYDCTIIQFLKYFLFGLGIWTITEYVFHRWVFHFNPTTEFQEYIHFMIHGIHHDYPNDAKRLVLPPIMSIPLATGFYFFFTLFFSAFALSAFFAGFILGYLGYDLLHYGLHHATFGKKSKLWQMLKKNHMDHHFVDPDKGFGVSNVFWDRVLKTSIKKATSKNESGVI